VWWRSESRADLKRNLLQKLTRNNMGCDYLLSDATNASNAPEVLVGSDKAKPVLKCNRAAQCNPLNHA
jgi:hypothetical protein